MGFILNLFSGFMWGVAVGVLVVVNTDIIIQQYHLYSAKCKMKQVCKRYTQYMKMHDTAKEAMDCFTKNIEELVDKIDNHKNEDTSNGRDE